MLKPVSSLFLSALLIGCSSRDEATPCSYKSEPQQELKESTAPELLGLGFSQKKLVELMWTPTAQSECFARKNGGVLVFKTAASTQNPNNAFAKLKPAPVSAQKNWQETQEDLRGTLLGLTTFRFYSTPQEKIVGAEILVLEAGRPWHLWHEYTHYLIGEFRVRSKELSLRNPRRQDLNEALDTALATLHQPEEFQTTFKAYSDLVLDYMQKAFMDEILIEKTLQDLASQSPDLLMTTTADFLESQSVIERFKDKYFLEFIPQKREAEKLLESLNNQQSEQRASLQVHLLRLDQQKSLLLSLVP